MLDLEIRQIQDGENVGSAGDDKHNSRIWKREASSNILMKSVGAGMMMEENHELWCRDCEKSHEKMEKKQSKIAKKEKSVGG